MKKYTFVISAVLMIVMMVSSCVSDASNEATTSNEVTIGDQVWIVKNLNADSFRNGD